MEYYQKSGWCQRKFPEKTISFNIFKYILFSIQKISSQRLNINVTTLKVKYECDYDFSAFLKECNKIKRIAFSLFKETEDKVKVTKTIKAAYNIDNKLVDASILEFQVGDAYALMKSCKKRGQKKMIFGSLNQWKRLNKGIISKKEFQTIRNTLPVLFTGRSNDSFGNRKIKLDIDNRQIIFKRTRNDHFNLKLITSNSRWKLLEKLQSFFEYNSTPITYKLSKDYIYISFDESILKEKEHEFIKNRIASLDINPNYIGFVIKDHVKDNITHKSIYDISELNKTNDKNKKDYEVVQIAKRISELCKHYKVECVGFEKLSMVSKNHKKGRAFNKLVNNSWNRNKFINNLRKRLNILGIQNQEILANYSSTVGCLDHTTETDSIAAAFEIGRRCYVFLNRYVKKEKEFLDVDVMFPPIDRGLIKERWNSILSDYSPKNIGYKGIHEYLKKEKKLNELRFLFKDYDFSSWSCFSLKSYKSLVRNYQKVSF